MTSTMARDQAEPAQVTFVGPAPTEPPAAQPVADPPARPDPTQGTFGPDAGSPNPAEATFGPGAGGSSPTDPDRPVSEPPIRVTFGPGPEPVTWPSVPGGIPDLAPQHGTGGQGADGGATGGGETGGSDNTNSGVYKPTAPVGGHWDHIHVGGGSSTRGPDGQAGTGDAPPRRRGLASRVWRPGRGPRSAPVVGPAQRRSWIVRAMAAARRARTYLTDPSPVRLPAGQLAGLPAPRPVRAPGRGPASGTPALERLTSLLRSWWRTGQDRASRFTKEDWRVIAILAFALIVTFGRSVDLGAPAPVTAPTTMPAAEVNVAAPAPAPAGGGMVDDPTSKGQITAATAHGLAEIRAHFGPALRGVSCWDKHEWNPKSDHPLGKACDIYTSPAKQFASGAGLDSGNQLVAWLRQHAGRLRVAYVIWQGRIWSLEYGDRKYTGGGVYDPNDPTGGHFDHIHVSYRN